MSSKILQSRPERGVVLMTLNRPAKHNALTVDLLTQLDEAVSELRDDPELRALVITGADPAFCAGLDLNDLGSGAAFSPALLNSLRTMTVPVIAAVNGVAITGGLELALAADFRIASERANFADTHTRVGVVPGWGLTARLPQAVGDSWARQMSFTGEFVDAGTALRIGLVNEVVPHDDVVQRAVQLATRIGAAVRATTAKVRHLYDLGRDGTYAEVLEAEATFAAGSFVMDAPDAFVDRRDALLSRSDRPRTHR